MVYCRGCVVSAHARHPLHRVKVITLVAACLLSNLVLNSIGMAPRGNRCLSLTLVYVCSSDTTAAHVQHPVTSTPPLRFITPTARIWSKFHSANAMSLLGVIYSPISSFGLHGSRPALLFLGLRSHLLCSSASITLHCRVKLRRMTFTTHWCTKRIILVSNPLL
jgi:hypothetical protein